MRTQTTISQGELGGLCFFRDPCTIAKSLAVRKAWEKPVFMGDRELGKARVAVSSDYEVWRKRRGMSQPSTSLLTSANSEELQAQVDALTQRIEIMGAQMRALEEREQESILTIDERLKDQCADSNEQAIRASKAARTSSDSQLQEITAKSTRLEAELENRLRRSRTCCKTSPRLGQKYTKSERPIGDSTKNRALAKLDELQALVVHQETKIKEAQKYSEDMSQAVQKQSEVLARHVRKAERELHRD
ncbi:unnamed protein product [Sphenostylis stenocarpa]|uniref:Uncharacterized protein n=1 Tax=Sphenostylis stenocarpa TaxID=92480 RepID=A0AA86VTY5_9FABA|nr:unnamed protein product [Sphenostylis stenocarpa]